MSTGDWELWASLNDVLPLIAESHPSEFLNAVDRALSMTPSPFEMIFGQECSGIFGRNYMTGLLWALETLAWDGNNLTRALVCLAELAARDPGGQWGNRPIGSMTTILLPWLPQTCASVERRVGAVRTVLQLVPRVGWNLLVALLPIIGRPVSQGRSISNKLLHIRSWQLLKERRMYQKFWFSLRG